MKNNIYFKWFMESLREDQKKDYQQYSLNEQKNWYIGYLEDHYSVKSAKSTLITLESVGAIIDKKTLLVYPLFKNNMPDFDNPMDLKYCSSEWIENLNKVDIDILTNL